MSKREKLLERLKNNPNNATFSEIRRLLKQEGFTLDRITGSHDVFTRNETTFVIPVHNNRVKMIYVKRVIELIEQTKDEIDEKMKLTKRSNYELSYCDLSL
ncbi:MAG: type II toxin-antitoxin system HicA family toxin [Leptolyngbyaceae cyanobacterium SM2_5_2]|nr:type II toxin-antitoxin system HicA family toxin [Leptolyngbyaceae cyanobacterium SM2_5_2]